MSYCKNVQSSDLAMICIAISAYDYNHLDLGAENEDMRFVSDCMRFAINLKCYN